MDRLVLWDIDGTLLRSYGLGVELFAAAMRAVVGPLPPGRPAMAGKTDRQIATEWLAALGATGDTALVEQVLAALAEAVRGAAPELRGRSRVLPGVEAVLERLARAGVAQSVCTGNLAANAAVKLRCFGLDRWLDLEVGAFGDHHVDRRALVPLALAARLRRDGSAPPAGAVWVVGDTPNDLAAARSAGARCLLVATGNTRWAELAALRPDAVFGDLGEEHAVATVLAS